MTDPVRHHHENRTYYRSLEDGMAAIGLHDASARASVREWFEAYPAAKLDPLLTAEEALASDTVRLWTTPSVTYLAVGHRYDIAIRDPLNEFIIAARIFRSRMEITSRGGTYGVVVLDPSYHPSGGVNRTRQRERPVMTCPSCFMVLPASGVCDTCA